MARVVSLESVEVILGGNTILKDVNLEVDMGEVYAIIGPNGSGKTTLLKVIAGLIEPFSGVVRVKGRASLVPQNDLLLPWLSLRDNILLPYRIHGHIGKDAVERLSTLSRLLRLESFLDLYPRQASGGTRRKAAIARALIVNPDILLLDEPFTGLDVASLNSLVDALARLRGRKTMILVSHEPYEIARLADRVGLLNGRPARIVDEIELTDMRLGERIETITQFMEKMLAQSPLYNR